MKKVTIIETTEYEMDLEEGENGLNAEEQFERIMDQAVADAFDDTGVRFVRVRSRHVIEHPSADVISMELHRHFDENPLALDPLSPMGDPELHARRCEFGGGL
jgi:hypothetical protein